MPNSLRRLACVMLCFSILSMQAGCTPSTLATKNDTWEVVIVSAKTAFGWHNIERFAGAGLLVMELKFHRLDSPENTSVSLADLNLRGYNNFDKEILAISKDSATRLTINGFDASQLEFLYCEQPPFSDYGCSYSVSAEGGLPDASSLAQIDDVLKEKKPELVLEASGDTLYVTLAFDDKGGNEDLVFTFSDLPPVTFTVE